MNFEEMQKWTARFNQILGGAQQLKEKRLHSLNYDIKLYLDKNADPFAKEMYSAVLEEMEGVPA